MRSSQTGGPLAQSTCQIKVPAPGFALVFLTDQSLSESDQGPTTTFATTAYTKLHATAAADPSVLAISNGEKAIAAALAGTSNGIQRSSPLGFAHALPSAAAVLRCPHGWSPSARATNPALTSRFLLIV